VVKNRVGVNSEEIQLEELSTSNVGERECESERELVIITGGTKAIGFETARNLLKHGKYHVIITGCDVITGK